MKNMSDDGGLEAIYRDRLYRRGDDRLEAAIEQNRTLREFVHLLSLIITEMLDTMPPEWHANEENIRRAKIVAQKILDSQFLTK